VHPGDDAFLFIVSIPRTVILGTEFSFFFSFTPSMKRKATRQREPKFVKRKKTVVLAQRHGFNSVARTRGAAVQGEMKYFDCDRNGGVPGLVTTTWVATTMQDPDTTINLGSAAVATPNCLFAPTVGAALNQRIGRKVKVHKIKVTGFVNKGPETAQTTGDEATTLRIMLVMDQQTNAAQMTGAQLMQDASATATTINTFQNPNNFGRFRVLKDKRITIFNANMAGEVAAANVIKEGLKANFKFKIRFRTPIDVHFNATNGGTVADIVDNSFHIVCGQTPAANCNLSYYSRVCYKE